MVSLSEVGGLAEDAQVVRSNMVENDQDADIEAKTNVLTDHHGCSITTSIRRSDYVNSASRREKSVFSRLAFSSEVCKQDEHDVDSSANEVMTILRQSHNQQARKKLAADEKAR